MDTVRNKIERIASNLQAGAGFNPLEPVTGLKMKDEHILFIALEYANLVHNPANTETRLAYNQFKRELIRQYRALKTVIKFEFTTENPYSTSQAMFEDIDTNGRLKVFTGGEYHASLKGLNKIFRAVHDILGHYLGKNSFSNNGEFKAYLCHKQTFSYRARQALFTETIGQNSFYKIKGEYAPQVSAIYPAYFLQLAEVTK